MREATHQSALNSGVEEELRGLKTTVLTNSAFFRPMLWLFTMPGGDTVSGTDNGSTVPQRYSWYYSYRTAAPGFDARILTVRPAFASWAARLNNRARHHCVRTALESLMTENNEVPVLRRRLREVPHISGIPRFVCECDPTSIFEPGLYVDPQQQPGQTFLMCSNCGSRYGEECLQRIDVGCEHWPPIEVSPPLCI